ncbi:MAG: hypothetical protein JWP31_1171 [Aeromicrobium sp.]|nr:hypothetical protein [Aeromicrobium sp.]
MTDDRSCTEQDLIDFCTTGHERVHRALVGGDPLEVEAVLEAVLSSRAAMLGTYQTWSTYTAYFLAHRLTPEGLGAWYDPEDDFTVASRNGMTLDAAVTTRTIVGPDSPIAAEVAALVRQGEAAAARARWDVVNASNQSAHHARRDLLTQSWTRIYLHLGAEALRDLLTEIGQTPGWTAFLKDGGEADAVSQVRDFAFILTVGNFGSATITEHADRFELRYNTCGSCGLQELGGRFERPWGFARTATELPEFNSGDAATTVYRAHQAMLHSVAAIDTIGKPYPVISCDGPGGKLGCTFLFFKGATPAEYYTRVGRQPVSSR